MTGPPQKALADQFQILFMMVHLGGVITSSTLAPQSISGETVKMRPSILNPLFADIKTIKGIGDKMAKLFAKLVHVESARLLDVLFHIPTGLIDRRFKCTISQLPVQGVATLEVTIGQHHAPPRGSKQPYRIEAFDDTGVMNLIYFTTYADHLLRQFPIGEKRLISGEISWFKAEAKMTHPDYVLSVHDAGKLPLLEPVYPLTAGISSKLIHKAAFAALEKLPPFPEWQDSEWLKRQAWPDFSTALSSLHSPSEINAEGPMRQRLAYDELLANQLALSLVRLQMKRASGRSMGGDAIKRNQIIKNLPYLLTNAQNKAISEILVDMKSEHRMIRLLQGDVGSGKTVVALMALAAAVESGFQGALMVPTEILARQHMEGLSKLIEGTGLRIAILTGREKGKARGDTLSALKSGEIDILIGTHALFQDGVDFKDLGLVVIDEQHRFGVHQRLALQAKSYQTDLLVMTATPIPRTLALTVYGDMDVSKLTEKPAGRLPIDTRVLPTGRIDDVIAGLHRSLSAGARAYWVCPLVEESEFIDLANAEKRFESLQTEFPNRVGLIHGRLKGVEKDAVMEKFKSGALSILVSTTVIEVGVDVPEASIMIIENAERFGLAQLHQLRGRVGRGSAKSSCLLLYQDPLGETAKSRLAILRETEDGFRIAEEDLKLRGAGEMLGTQQSGLPLFRVADLAIHGDLLATARDDASLILSRDPKLTSPRGEALRTLLYLFERDEAIKLLSSG
jgi:ATP-dependent DNA helicase RecG